MEEFQSKRLNQIEITGGTMMTEEGQIWTNGEQSGEEDGSSGKQASDLKDGGENSPVEKEFDGDANSE